MFLDELMDNQEIVLGATPKLVIVVVVVVVFLSLVSRKVIPLKFFSYQTFFET